MQLTTSKRSANLVLAVLCAAQFVLIVDVVVVNVAIPSIRADLGIAAELLQLTSVTYTVAFGSLLVLAGRLGDLYGRKRLLLVGLTVFTSMSLLCGLAGEDWQLFAARAGQGVGAALVSPNALALLVGSFGEGTSRNRALGVWAAVGSAGAIAGQLIGGVVTELVGWRGVFLINVPFGLVAMMLAIKAMWEPAGQRSESRLDVGGAVLLTAVLGGLSLILADLASGAGRRTVVGGGLVAMLALALLVVERRHPDPMLPAGLLRRPNVAVGNIVLALNAGALVALLYFATLTMQTELGYGPLQTGLGFAPITAIVLAVSPRVGGLVGRFGARPLLIIGAACAAAGAGILALSFGHADSYWTGILPGLGLVALGSALTYAPVFSLATAVPDSEQGRASGLINTAQELGGAGGLAVLGAIAAGSAVAGQLVDFGFGYLTAAAVFVLSGVVVFAGRMMTERSGQPGNQPRRDHQSNP